MNREAFGGLVIFVWSKVHGNGVETLAIRDDLRFEGELRLRERLIPDFDNIISSEICYRYIVVKATISLSNPAHGRVFVFL